MHAKASSPNCTALTHSRKRRFAAAVATAATAPIACYNHCTSPMAILDLSDDMEMDGFPGYDGDDDEEEQLDAPQSPCTISKHATSCYLTKT
jgi:hypothetical protein